jgi:hypothetical protein
MSGPPARLDRAAFERVLQRASELQAQRQDVGETLSEEEILALGREVGIAESHLRQALVETRMETEVAVPPAGVLDRLVGPADLVVERVVPGSTETVGAALTAWFEKHELLAVQRSTPTRIAWEHLESFAGAMRKMRAAFDASRGPSYLERAQLVTAVLTPLEDGYCHVTLVASLRKTRAGFVGGSSVLPIVGAAASGIAVVVGAPVALLLVGVVPTLGLGWLVARTYRGVAARARVGLLRALDELERRPLLPRPAETTPGPGRAIARDIGGVVREITREVRKAIEEGKR